MGVPVSGALDAFSYLVGNLLLGQSDECSCLEMTMIGPKLKTLEDISIALTGADFFPEINGCKVPMWTVLKLRKDEILTTATARQGCRAYLCVKGGFDVPVVLGSRSTNVRLKLGGFEGRPLKEGDRLRVLSTKGCSRTANEKALDKDHIPVYESSVELRVIMGPHDHYFSVEGLETFSHSEYLVSIDSNREGMRLTGPTVSFRKEMPKSIPSEASPPGGVQIRPNGEPLILMNDLSGGGYARMGHIISCDMPKAAQLAPGGSIRFKAVDVSKAHEIVAIYNENLEEMSLGTFSKRNRHH
jgi:antagonist of KipI